MVRSSRPFGSQSTTRLRFSPTTPPMAAALAITPSSVPYCVIHFAAVFGPTFSTPGTLSMLSPTSAR